MSYEVQAIPWQICVVSYRNAGIYTMKTINIELCISSSNGNLFRITGHLWGEFELELELENDLLV